MLVLRKRHTSGLPLVFSLLSSLVHCVFRSCGEWSSSVNVQNMETNGTYFQQGAWNSVIVNAFHHNVERVCFVSFRVVSLSYEELCEFMCSGSFPLQQLQTLFCFQLGCHLILSPSTWNFYTWWMQRECCLLSSVKRQSSLWCHLASSSFC